MYPSFTQPQEHSTSQQPDLGWYSHQVPQEVLSYPLTPTLSSQSQQHLDFMLPHELQQQQQQQQQYHSHTTSYPHPHTSQSTHPYHHDVSLQSINPYTPQFQVPPHQQPSHEQPPHWQHLTPLQQHQQSPSPQLQAQPFVSQHFVHSEVSSVSAALSWSPLEHGHKDLLTATEGLSLYPVAVNPAQIYASASPPRARVRADAENDSAEGTDDDNDARLQLSDLAYPSSTPPLSPSASDHPHHPHHQYHRLHHMPHPHSGIFQSLTGLNTTVHPTPGLTDDGHDLDSEHDERHPEDRSENYKNSVRANGDGDIDYDDDAEGEIEEAKVKYDVDDEEEEEDELEEEEEEEEERLFQCQQCQKRFLRQYNLNAHLKTHSSERAHNCDQCSKSFLRPYDLSRHQRIHSKDKPYSCKICSMIFIRNDAIWRHYRKVHHGHPDVPTSRRERKQKQPKCSSRLNMIRTPRARTSLSTSASVSPTSAPVTLPVPAPAPPVTSNATFAVLSHHATI